VSLFGGDDIFLLYSNKSGSLKKNCYLLINQIIQMKYGDGWEWEDGG
jgi:hypothetical protein